MYARNPERDAIWDAVLEWMVHRGSPLRPRELEEYDRRLVRDVLEEMAIDGRVACDDRGDFFEPGPRLEQFETGVGSSRRQPW